MNPESPRPPRERRSVPRANRSASADLEARTLELGRIQSIGRLAAEARTPRDLFLGTASILLAGEPLDLVAVAHAVDGAPELLMVPGRSIDPVVFERIRAMAARIAGYATDASVRVETVEDQGFDAAIGVREAIEDQDLVVVPLHRRGAPIAWLLALPESGTGEDRLRLTYSAANQITVHLDRILASRRIESERLSTILSSMPQAVMLADERFRLLQTNGSADRLLDELEIGSGGDGRAFFERIGLVDRIEQVLGGERPIVNEEITLDEGRVFDVTVTPIAGDGPSGRTALLVLNEVTERRRLQVRLAHSEKMSSLGQMISGVTHELNNPLSTILGFTQLLGSTTRDEALARRMNLLHDEAVRCQRIVQNLLSFARRREPERNPLSINEVVRSVAALMRYQLKVDDVRLETELDDDLPAMRGDRHQLQQVLVNLVANAKHALSDLPGPGTIVLRTRTSPTDGVLLDVVDNGPGVPEALRSKIFDPFFTTKPEGKGTGLGLSLVYGIVTSHEGSIEVQATPGGGATFHLGFPSYRTGAPALETCEAAETLASGAPARILVVDDEPRFAEMLEETLSADGHEVVTAADGQEGLEQLGRGPFDLVISDFRMPGMDGGRFAAELERLPLESMPRLLITTGDTLSAETRELEERIGAAILHKPFELAELRRRVRECLAGREES